MEAKGMEGEGLCCGCAGAQEGADCAASTWPRGGATFWPCISDGAAPSIAGNPDSTNVFIGATTSRDEGTLELPFIFSLYTMPSSPLHSSGLSAESPSRHLLRISLPTAQYRVSDVKDPLTGEMRTAPPKPAWLLVLEEEGGGAVVELVVRPANERVKKAVCINGKEVPCPWGEGKFNELGAKSCWMIGLQGWACSQGEFLA